MKLLRWSKETALVISRQNSHRTRIASLYRAAQQTNVKGGVATPFSLAFLTDRTRIPNPEIILRMLPKGVAVVLRDYQMPQRTTFARRLKSICDQRGLKLIIGGDVALAHAINADGIHLPSWLTPDKSALESLMVTASCHSAQEIERAAQLGAHIAFLSPAFPTDSHPGSAYLGPQQFDEMAATAAIPVMGLGGIDVTNAAKLAGPNVAGFGAIGAFNI